MTVSVAAGIENTATPPFFLQYINLCCTHSITFFLALQAPAKFGKTDVFLQKSVDFPYWLKILTQKNANMFLGSNLKCIFYILNIFPLPKHTKSSISGSIEPQKIFKKFFHSAVSGRKCSVYSPVTGFGAV